MANQKKSTLLRDVSPENAFWCNNGIIFKNLYDLESGFKNMPADVYVYHANSEKNDFSNWVSDILGDKRLASELKKCKSKEDAAKKVSAKIKALK
jgi:hypothetical protein